MYKNDAVISDHFISLIDRVSTMYELYNTFNVHGASPEDIAKYKKSLAEARRELQELNHNMTIKLKEWDINE